MQTYNNIIMKWHNNSNIIGIEQDNKEIFVYPSFIGISTREKRRLITKYMTVEREEKES